MKYENNRRERTGPTKRACRKYLLPKAKFEETVREAGKKLPGPEIPGYRDSAPAVAFP